MKISTHYLTQRSTTQQEYYPDVERCQLTTSRRGRLVEALEMPEHTKFQLTTSRRGRPARAFGIPPSILFQLTTSRRGRPGMNTMPRTLNHFNSLPHAEVDPLFSSISLLLPYFNSLPHAEVDVLLLSIFAPSVIFQLTTSRRGRRARNITSQQEYIFQLTTSRRGRPRLWQLWYCCTHFNSLPHAEVDSNLSQNLWTLTIDSITNRIINLCFLL